MSLLCKSLSDELCEIFSPMSIATMDVNTIAEIASGSSAARAVSHEEAEVLERNDSMSQCPERVQTPRPVSKHTCDIPNS